MNQMDIEQQLISKHMLELDENELDLFAIWFLDTYEVIRERKETENDLIGNIGL